MTGSTVTNEEKKQLMRLRQSAVRKAWKAEKIRVQNGVGTRNWTSKEQKELLERGSVHGYEGHHMKSVSLFPEYAGEPQNIQFLTEDEHFFGAHQSSYQRPTNGYYDPETKEMHEFKGSRLPKIEEKQLEDIDNKEIVAVRGKYKSDHSSGKTDQAEDISRVRESYRSNEESSSREGQSMPTGEGRSDNEEITHGH